VTAALAAASGLAAAADAVPVLDTVSTFGRGDVRQVESITAAEIAQLPPGSSPLEAIARFPSVKFDSADSQGAYEWSARITVRGFNQNQLGFTLDDIPLGDMSYGNYNGLHISRAVITENVGRATLAQGAGSLETASSSNLGGTIQFYSLDPSKKFGAFAAQSVGSHSDRRSVLRVESGETGVGRGYISFVDQQGDKWKGTGEHRSAQINFKYALDFGQSKLTAIYNTSRRREIDYQDLNAGQLGASYNLDNTYPDFNAALNIANTVCGHGTTTLTSACNYQYYAGSGLRNDELAAVTLDAALSDTVRFKNTVYNHHDRGDGLWYTPYTASSATMPISIRTTEYGINRSGLNSALSINAGSHDIKTGVWLETNYFGQARRFYAINSATDVPSPYVMPSNPALTQWQYQFKTTTEQFFLADTWHASEHLTVNGGFKSLSADVHGDLVAGSGKAAGDIKSQKSFLPQLGVNYTLAGGYELFANYAQNMHTLVGAGTSGPFSASVTGFNAIKSSLQPETAHTIEGGLRFGDRDYDGVAALYHVSFENRLLAVTQGVGIQGLAAVVANVGGVTMDGAEYASTWRFAPTWSWYNALGYNRSTYDSDYLDNGNVRHTAGQRVVDVPGTTLKTILSTNWNGYFANLGADYEGPRYYTYSNDGRVGGRTLVSLSGGYRAQDLGMVKEATLEFSVTNLTDKKYASTIGSNGFVYSDPGAVANPTLQAGAPRAFFVTGSGRF
jgi:iron complex outermembrane receptor protein